MISVNTRPLRSRRGFTLVEIMVVIVIIGILAGLTGLGLDKVRSNSRKKVCLAQIAKLGEAKRGAWGYYEDLSTRTDPDGDVVDLMDQDKLPVCPDRGAHQPSAGTKPTKANVLASYSLDATTKGTDPTCKINTAHKPDNE